MLEKNKIDLSQTTIFIILVLFLLILLMLISQLKDTLLNGFFILPFVFISVYFYLRKRVEREYTLYFILLFMFFISFYSLLLHFISAFRLQKDSIAYTQFGLEIANYIRKGALPNFPKEGFRHLSFNSYILFNGIIFALVGETYYGMQLINIMFLTLAVFNITCIFKLLYGQELPKLVLLGLLIYPSFYWHACTNLRDAISLFFISATIFFLTKYLIKGKLHWGKLIFSLVGVGLSRVTNIGMILVFGVLILVRKLFAELFSKKLKISHIFFIFIIACIIIIFIWFWGKFFLYYSLENIEYATLVRSKAGFSLQPRVVEGGFFDLVKSYPLAAFNFLLIPYPWSFAVQFTKVYIDELYIFFFLLISLLGILKSSREYKYFTFSLIFCLFVTSFMYGLYDVDAAAASRHRMQFIPFFFIFVGRACLQRVDMDLKKSKIMNL